MRMLVAAGPQLENGIYLTHGTIFFFLGQIEMKIRQQMPTIHGMDDPWITHTADQLMTTVHKSSWHATPVSLFPFHFIEMCNTVS